MATDLNGEELVRLAAEDRDAALTLLVHQYRREIYDLCVRIAGDHDEAEDLAQETFVQAYEHLPAFRGEASPRTWLYRIAFNRALSFKRRLKRWRMQRATDESDIFETLPALAQESAENEIVRRDLAARAHEELSRLPVRQRTAVVLRTVNELSYAEIAEVMGTTTGGAKANVHQGVKKLRLALADDAPVRPGDGPSSSAGRQKSSTALSAGGSR